MKRLALSLSLFLLPFLSFSWHDAGHMTGGAIAYYYLRQNNPAVLKSVLTTFKQHPWYTTKWEERMKGLTGEQRDVAVFMLASVWPDDVRRDNEYGGSERARWHYINYPVVAKGYQINKKPIPAPNAENRLMELNDTLKIQADTKEKAINLCWLFHVLEDIHQPLHTVALFDENHPEGDKGGNDTYIRFSETTEPVKLHTYWDGLIPGTMSSIPAQAEALLSDVKYKGKKLKELSANKKVNDWIKKEGISLATAVVYKNVTIRGTQSSPTLVDAAYATEAKALAEKRVVLSGIRLAKKLAEIYPASK